MKQFLVPMFALVEANDAGEAAEIAADRYQSSAPAGLLIDEDLTAVELPPDYEAHSICDVFLVKPRAVYRA